MLTVDIIYPARKRPLVRDDQQFEQKHPRGEGGKFAKKGTAPLPPQHPYMSKQLVSLLDDLYKLAQDDSQPIEQKLNTLTYYAKGDNASPETGYAKELIDWLKEDEASEEKTAAPPQPNLAGLSNSAQSDIKYLTKLTAANDESLADKITELEEYAEHGSFYVAQYANELLDWLHGNKSAQKEDTSAIPPKPEGLDPDEDKVVGYMTETLHYDYLTTQEKIDAITQYADGLVGSPPVDKYADSLIEWLKKNESAGWENEAPAELEEAASPSAEEDKPDGAEPFGDYKNMTYQQAREVGAKPVAYSTNYLKHALTLLKPAVANKIDREHRKRINAELLLRGQDNKPPVAKPAPATVKPTPKPVAPVQKPAPAAVSTEVPNKPKTYTINAKKAVDEIEHIATAANMKPGYKIEQIGKILTHWSMPGNIATYGEAWIAQLSKGMSPEAAAMAGTPTQANPVPEKPNPVGVSVKTAVDDVESIGTNPELSPADKIAKIEALASKWSPQGTVNEYASKWIEHLGGTPSETKPSTAAPSPASTYQQALETNNKAWSDFLAAEKSGNKQKMLAAEQTLKESIAKLKQLQSSAPSVGNTATSATTPTKQTTLPNGVIRPPETSHRLQRALAVYDNAKKAHGTSTEEAKAIVPSLKKEFWQHVDEGTKTQVKWYTMDGSTVINTALRDWNAQPSSNVVDAINRIDDLFDEGGDAARTKDDVLVVRGEDIPTEMVEHWAKALQQNIPVRYARSGFTSASMASFTPFNNRNAVLEIVLPKGTPVLGIDAVSPHNENEVLLRHGMSFEVFEIRKEGKQNRIKMVLVK